MLQSLPIQTAQSGPAKADDGSCWQAKGYKLDYDHWHAAVHGSLPYDELLHKDAKLTQALRSIPLPKYIFTNADITHAETCLKILGLEDMFQV